MCIRSEQGWSGLVEFTSTVASENPGAESGPHRTQESTETLPHLPCNDSTVEHVYTKESEIRAEIFKPDYSEMVCWTEERDLVATIPRATKTLILEKLGDAVEVHGESFPVMPTIEEDSPLLDGDHQAVAEVAGPDENTLEEEPNLEPDSDDSDVEQPPLEDAEALEPLLSVLMRTVDLLVRHGAVSKWTRPAAFDPDYDEAPEPAAADWILARPDCTSRVRDAANRGELIFGSGPHFGA